MYLNPSQARNRTFSVRGPRGLGQLLGLGDTDADLTAAQAKLMQAGYAGAQCAIQTVPSPSSPGGFYTQQICSAPGYAGGMDVNAILSLSPSQLQAQRAMENAPPTAAQLTGSNTQNFNVPAGGSQVAYFGDTPSADPFLRNLTPLILNSPMVGPPVPAPSPAVAPRPTPVPSIGPLASAATSSPAKSPAPSVLVPLAPSTSGSSLSSVFSSSLTLGGVSVPFWAIGAGVLLIPFLLGGRR